MSVSSIKLRPDEIHCDFIRSSGPGGQNVNKVATAVQLRFNVRDTQSLSPEIRDRLIGMAGKRVNASGELVIEARRFRTQQRNREDAMERLVQMIEKALIRPKVRHKSRPTAASYVRRLQAKKRRSGIKKLRTRASDDG
jgi:ribosome-associated protein